MGECSVGTEIGASAGVNNYRIFNILPEIMKKGNRIDFRPENTLWQGVNGIQQVSCFLLGGNGCFVFGKFSLTGRNDGQ